MTTVLEDGVKELKDKIGISAACRVMNVPRQSFHRHHRLSPAPPKPAPVPHNERVQPQALTEAERETVHQVLASDRFADASPAHVHATLLDEDHYLCSTTTMYRLIRQKYGHATDRRDQAVHPARVTPARPSLSSPRGSGSWTPPTPPTPNASAAAGSALPSSTPPSTSTSPRARRRRNR
ncbi:hypothetical protein AB0H73_39680 [Streptomyces olivoreticuli]